MSQLPIVPGEKLRVALFTGNYNYIRDGVALTLNRLVRYLVAHNVEVLIFAPTGPKPAFESFGEVVSVPSFPIPFRTEYRIATKMTAPARQRLADFNPHLIHIAIPDYLGYQALRYGMKHDIPVVSSFHSRFDVYLEFYGAGFLKPLGHRYLYWFYSHCAQVYPPSDSMAEVISAQGYGRDIRVWSRGIDPAMFNPAKRDLAWRRSRGIADSDVLINFTGRVVKEKNTDLFADCLNRLRAKGLQFHVLVVGDGPDLANLKAALPFGQFAGVLGGEELAKAYASSDIFFFPSESETFGNVTLEASASGLPCVCANATGSRSIVLHNETGYLCDARKPEEFISALEGLMTNADLRAKLGHAAIARSHTFSWDQIMAKLLANYQDVLDVAKTKKNAAI